MKRYFWIICQCKSVRCHDLLQANQLLASRCAQLSSVHVHFYSELLKCLITAVIPVITGIIQPELEAFQLQRQNMCHNRAKKKKKEELRNVCCVFLDLNALLIIDVVWLELPVV